MAQLDDTMRERLAYDLIDIVYSEKLFDIHDLIYSKLLTLSDGELIHLHRTYIKE